LSVFFLFRFRHPPLLIPWTEIDAEQRKAFWRFTAMTLYLGREAQVPLTFYNQKARELVASFLKSPMRSN
jgi:hypothetical protein